MTHASARSTSSEPTGQVLVVPGGTGNIAEGIVRTFLAGGTTVIFPSRSQERLDQLTELMTPELCEGNRLCHPLLIHTALAHAFAPRLTEGGSYTIMAGITAYTAQPGARLPSMQGPALLMMRSAPSTELNGQGRVNALVLAPVINRSRPHGDRNWLTADQVGEASVAVALDSSVAGQDVMVRTKDELSAWLQRTHRNTALS